MFDDADKIELLKLARATLFSYFKDGTTPDFKTSKEPLLAKKGAFVSLHNQEELRGCIGQLFPDQELYKIVQHCVLSAALEDSRFYPVKQDELPDLNIEISVLSPFSRIHNVREIEVGKHGIYVIHGNYRGLLLPQVAANYGWDRQAFLEQTCRKAGLPESAWRDPRCIIHTFEGEVFDEQTLLTVGAGA
jgi:AmmeMemoRadiSam system protein A